MILQELFFQYLDVKTLSKSIDRESNSSKLLISAQLNPHTILTFITYLAFIHLLFYIFLI